MAADEFHSGGLATLGAAVGHRLIQILEDDLPGPGLLNLRHRHPAGQVISPSGDHFPQFGFGYRSAVWAWQRIPCPHTSKKHGNRQAESDGQAFHSKQSASFL